MKTDRDKIVSIISKMLDNPDNSGIYPTTEAFKELEEYVQEVRMMTFGWVTADMCVCLDNGNDPRELVFPEMVSNMYKDLDIID